MVGRLEIIVVPGSIAVALTLWVYLGGISWTFIGAGAALICSYFMLNVVGNAMVSDRLGWTRL